VFACPGRCKFTQASLNEDKPAIKKQLADVLKEVDETIDASRILIDTIKILPARRRRDASLTSVEVDFKLEPALGERSIPADLDRKFMAKLKGASLELNPAGSEKVRLSKPSSVASSEVKNSAAPADNATPSSSGNTGVIIAVVVVGLVLLVAIIVGVIFIRKRKLHAATTHDRGITDVDL